MIFSSVDLPEPFRPSTPIFAPGKERQADVAQDDALGRHDLADPVHGVDELSHRADLTVEGARIIDECAATVLLPCAIFGPRSVAPGSSSKGRVERHWL